MPIDKEIFPKVEENTVQVKTIEVEKLFKALAEMPSDFYSETRIDEASQKQEDL